MTEDRLSRRDFLKLAAAGATAAVLGATELYPRIRGEVPPSKRVMNGLEVCRELVKAEASQDQEKIIEARKLVVVWAFAESTSLFAKEAGLEKAGKMMEHYLYGEGQDLDISPWFDEVADQKQFWLNLVREAFGHYYFSLGKEDSYSGISREEFFQLFQQLQDKLRKGFTFPSAVGARDREGMDWTWAVGHSTYTLQCESQIDTTEDAIVIALQNMNVKMFDIYDWELTFETSISDKAWVFASLVSQPLFSLFLNTEDSVDRMLEKIGLPQKERQIVRDTIDAWRVRTGSKISDLSRNVRGMEEWAGGQIVERDMNLLKKIGARDYTINASFRYPSKVEIPTSPTDYLFLP